MMMNCFTCTIPLSCSAVSMTGEEVARLQARLRTRTEEAMVTEDWGLTQEGDRTSLYSHSHSHRTQVVAWRERRTTQLVQHTVQDHTVSTALYRTTQLVHHTEQDHTVSSARSDGPHNVDTGAVWGHTPTLEPHTLYISLLCGKWWVHCARHIGKCD